MEPRHLSTVDWPYGHIRFYRTNNCANCKICPDKRHINEQRAIIAGTALVFKTQPAADLVQMRLFQEQVAMVCLGQGPLSVRLHLRDGRTPQI